MQQRQGTEARVVQDDSEADLRLQSLEGADLLLGDLAGQQREERRALASLAQAVQALSARVGRMDGQAGGLRSRKARSSARADGGASADSHGPVSAADSCRPPFRNLQRRQREGR